MLMQTTLRYAFCAGLLALVACASTYAQTNEAQSSSTDLLDATCGQYMAAVRSADPGPNPSSERQSEAEEAKDALVDSMLWLHGYRSGIAGAAAEPQPLTREWMVDNIGRLARNCEALGAGDARLIDAARRP